MAEHKEFESLDELFRKTFQDLPDTPSTSGWDTPSERVWQHVQKQIKPPRSGWSTQTVALLAAFAVTLVLGLYLLLNRPDAQTETPVVAPELPSANVEANDPTLNEATARAEEEVNVAHKEQLATPPRPKQGKKAFVRQPTASQIKAESEAANTPQAESAQSETVEKSVAEKMPVSPNTTKRLKAELAKKAQEAWETPLAPLPQRWPGKPNK